MRLPLKSCTNGGWLDLDLGSIQACQCGSLLNLACVNLTTGLPRQTIPERLLRARLDPHPAVDAVARMDPQVRSLGIVCEPRGVAYQTL